MLITWAWFRKRHPNTHSNSEPLLRPWPWPSIQLSNLFTRHFPAHDDVPPNQAWLLKHPPDRKHSLKKKSYGALSIMRALTLTLTLKIAQPTFSHSNLTHADRCTTTPSLVAKGSAIQKISSQEKPGRHKDKWFQYNPSPNFVFQGERGCTCMDERGIKYPPPPINLPPHPNHKAERPTHKVLVETFVDLGRCGGSRLHARREAGRGATPVAGGQACRRARVACVRHISDIIAAAVIQDVFVCLLQLHVMQLHEDGPAKT